MATPPMFSLMKKTLSGNKVISLLQELRKDDWWAIKAYIYITYIYLTRIKLFDQVVLLLMN